MFGRKKAAADPGAASDPKLHRGHQWVLAHLRQKDREDPTVRLRVAATGLLDTLLERLAQPERGVRIEDLLALLGAVGGHCCLAAVLGELRQGGVRPQDAGMAVATGKDGHLYYFGDAPNRLLLESNLSLLSLALGAAHSLGAPVSLELAYEVMQRTAASVGTPEFGAFDLPAAHAPSLPSFEWVKIARGTVIEFLDLYEVPPVDRPTAIGLAVYQAMERGKDVLDPLLAARIVIQCAVPMAKVDPGRFD